MKAYAFAGDLEVGDKLLRGQVVSRSTDIYGGFMAHVLESNTRVTAVGLEHPFNPDRVMVRLDSRIVLDLHRSNQVKIQER